MTEAGENYNVMRLNATVEVDTGDSQQKLGEVEQKAEQTTDSLEKTGQKAFWASEGFQAVGGTLVKLGNLLIGAVSIPLAAIATKSVIAAAAVEDSVGTFTAVMGVYADEATAWVAEFAGAHDLARGELRKSMVAFQQMFESIGLTSREALDMSKAMTVLGEDMAAFYNMKPDEVFNRLQAGMAGSYRSLRELNIIIDESAVKTYAYQNGIAELGAELTDTQEVQARYGLIMEQTTKIHGEVGRSADTFNEQLRQLKMHLNSIWSDFGAIILPYATKFIAALKDIVKWVRSWSEETRKIIVGLAAFAFAVGPVLKVVGSLILYIPTLINGIKLIGWALQALTGGPIGLAIAGISALILLFTKLKTASAESAQAQQQAINDYMEAERKKQAVEFDEWADKERQKQQLYADGLQDRLAAIDEESRKLQETWTEDTNNLKDQLRDRREELNDLHQETLRQLRKEYSERIKLISLEIGKKIDAYQKEIDEIYDRQEAESDAIKEASLRDKIAETGAVVERIEAGKKALAAKKAMSAEERQDTLDLIATETEARKAWAEAQIALVRWQNDQADEARIEYLQGQIEGQETLLDNITTSLNDELQQKIDTETEKYNAAVKSIDDQIDYLDKSLARRKKIQDEDVAEAKRAEEQKTLDSKAEVDKRIADRERELSILAREKQIAGETAQEIARVTDEIKKLNDAKLEGGGGGGGGNVSAGFWGYGDNAVGGTVSRGGMMVVGERGPEIIYQPKGASIIPLAANGGAGTGTANIFVQLDGRTIAQVIGQPLVDEIRLRTGLRI